MQVPLTGTKTIMQNAQHDMPENYGDVSSFITEETHRLATISINDYGVQLSARMAQTYVLRALYVLEAKRSFDRIMVKEIGDLKKTAWRIAAEYAQLEKFSADCDRFNHRATKNAIEWSSKQLVRLISTGYLGTASHLLAHKIRAFHSKVCSILIEE